MYEFQDLTPISGHFRTNFKISGQRPGLHAQPATEYSREVATETFPQKTAHNVKNHMVPGSNRGGQSIPLRRPDWLVEQRLTSHSTQFRSFRRRRFYRSDDPTNSVKALPEDQKVPSKYRVLDGDDRNRKDHN